MAGIDIKNPADRNKLIIAIVLGVFALATLWYAFFGGRSSTSSSGSTTASATQTPKPGSSPTRQNTSSVNMPTQSQQDLAYQTTPVEYYPGGQGAPVPGRNIFAFYEPPPPCPECPPPPTPYVPPPTPTPLPAAPYGVNFITPQNVFAGSKQFRIEVNGDRFTPDARINFNGVELPTTFINPQRLAANVPANMVVGAGSGQIVVRSPDGTKYSYPMMMAIQAPPRPTFAYVGMIARKLANNDTGYFLEQGKQTPVGLRLNDVIDNRFRLVGISSEKAVFEDTSLGFRHSVDLYRPPPGTIISTGSPSSRPGSFVPYNRGNPNYQNIPGVNNGIPPYRPPNPNANPQQRPKDEDEDDPTTVEPDEDTDNR